MPDLQTLLLFAAACFALTATPGPDMVLIASRSIGQGRLSGFVTLAGIQVGTYVHAVAAALGLSQLFILVPIAYDVVRWLGAVYLLYLAWTTWQGSSPAPTDQRPNETTTMLLIFRQGLVTNLLNPKMVLFVLALFPQFVRPDAGSVALQIMVFATILNAIGLFVNGGVILAAAKAQSYFRTTSGYKSLQRYILPTVFTGLALRLATAPKQ
jgi:threonine/homoserine/homoserine lactone efflux protein